MSVDRVVKAVKSGAGSPRLVVVHGDDDLAATEAVASIVGAAKSAGCQILRAEGKKLDLPALCDEIAQVSLFGERRLLIVRGVPANAAALEEIADRVLVAPDVTLLVEARGGIDRRLRWYKTLVKNGEALQFKEPKDHEVPERVRGLAAAAGVEISPEAAQSIAARVGTDLLTARNEVAKLALFVHPKKRIDADDVEQVVGKSAETKIWEITEGIGTRDRSRALAALGELLEQGIGTGAILSMVAREVRFLLQARSFLRQGGARAATGSYGSFQNWFRSDCPPDWKERFGEARSNLFKQHPFVVFQRLKQAPRFKTGELFRLLASLSRADRLNKSGADETAILYGAVGAAAGNQ